MTQKKYLSVLRLAMGWLFLWAFIDKLFGLGFSTPRGQAWLDGVSPTFGYLTHATRGPLAGIFQGLAGHWVVDVVFMVGLLGVGLAYTLGWAMKIASYSGALMVTLMYLATALPPVHNPLIDEHIIYGLIFLMMASIPVGDWWGLGVKWKKLPYITKRPWLY